MTRGPRCTPRTQAALGLALCVVLAWPPLRHALEASRKKGLLAASALRSSSAPCPK